MAASQVVWRPTLSSHIVAWGFIALGCLGLAQLLVLLIGSNGVGASAAFLGSALRAGLLLAAGVLILRGRRGGRTLGLVLSVWFGFLAALIFLGAVGRSDFGDWFGYESLLYVVAFVAAFVVLKRDRPQRSAPAAA